jgi:hypothetical protein
MAEEQAKQETNNSSLLHCSADFFFKFFFDLQKWEQYVPPKRRSSLQTTSIQCYNPENSTLHSHRREDLKSDIVT